MDKSWISTLCYVVGSCEVDDTPEIAEALGKLTIILQGPGLLKTRHFPVIVAQIEDLVSDVHHFGDPLTDDEIKLVADLEETAAGIRSGQLIPPLERDGIRHPLRQALLNAERLKEVFPQNPDQRRFFLQSNFLQKPLFSGWRPYMAEKPFLPAPDFTDVRDRANSSNEAGQPP